MEPKPFTCPEGQTHRGSSQTFNQHGGPASYHRYNQQPCSPGQLLNQGHYTILRFLAHGGMSALYLARDNTNDRQVVIKVRSNILASDSERRLAANTYNAQDAARLHMRLEHPAIPSLFDFFCDSQHTYLVMEYVDGYDLEQKLTRIDPVTNERQPGKPYPVEDVIRWGVALCHVLEYLSQPSLAVVHHDIKPANLMIDATGQHIFVIDFDIAHTGKQPQTAKIDSQESNYYGTAGYAPPEQYHGQSNLRSDVYALAATLYHLVTDDAPTVHPFKFSRLARLGKLGSVLQAALQIDINQRSTATVFRQQLEALLKLGNVALLRAPDGTGINTRSELVDWCENNWEEATAWLYTSLPRQLGIWWGQTDTARVLRAITRQHHTRHAGLDAALAFLDPNGYGAAPQRITADTSQIACDVPDTDVVAVRTLVFTNIGRRYVHAQITHPDWVLPEQTRIVLAPGRHIVLKLIANVRRATRGKILRGKLELYTPVKTILQVDVCATRSTFAATGHSMSRQLQSLAPSYY